MSETLQSVCLWLIPGCPLAAAVIVAFFGRALFPRSGHRVVVLALLVSCVLSLVQLWNVALEASLPGTALRIAGQRDRLKQAILNVAINALEAMSDGGALGMRLEALPEHAEVLITDSGPGIPEEVRLRIFDMHFTTKTSGTGIGLYVARSIVEAHGGEISVESAPGRNRFRLRLPALG